ncbi:7878_t:CDS:10 [Diversispora eburnea]|uniref:Chromatin-remodeling ATPase INO80 n=1 Tax=Diversispora eburnea TaxID=1213867 RepID=A0A9N8ZCS4_9GLOM|nr:7878_t:CDS:10 [Diversispora eburnea]
MNNYIDITLQWENEMKATADKTERSELLFTDTRMQSYLPSKYHAAGNHIKNPSQRPPPPSSNRTSSFNLNHLLNSDDQPLSHTSGHYSLPPLTTHSAPYSQSTLSFSSYASQSGSPHYGHSHNDFSTSPSLSHTHPIQPSIPPIQQLPYSNSSWDYPESASRQLPSNSYKLDHAPSVPTTSSTLTFFHSNINQIMSISGLLSRDTNDDTEYSFSKLQKDSNNNGAYDEEIFGARSNVAQVQTTTDSAEEKESAASISEGSLRASDRSNEGESTGDDPNSPSMIIPPPTRKIPIPEPVNAGNGLVVKLKTNENHSHSVSSNRESQEPEKTNTTTLRKNNKTSTVASPLTVVTSTKSIKTTRERTNKKFHVSQKPPSRVPKSKKSSRLDISEVEHQVANESSTSSDSSEYIITREEKTKHRQPEDSSDSSSSDSSSSGSELDERFNKELVNYMVEIYKRQKRVVDEFNKKCETKKEIVRRKFASRLVRIGVKGHISEKDVIEAEGSRQKGRKANKKESKRANRKSDRPAGNDENEKRVVLATKLQKQQEAYEMEERRRIWKDIMNKIVNQSITSRANNCRKIAVLCQKEARKAACKSCKSPKDIQTRSRQAMRQMLCFWKRNEKEERELRKKAEREALERMRVEEEMREAKRQARKLNFLITQTELYSHFVGKKIGTQAAEGNSTQTYMSTSGQAVIDQGAESSPAELNTDEDNNLNNIIPPQSFKDINFDEEDEEALREKARVSAQNALAQVKQHTRDFDAERKITTGGGKSIDAGASNEYLDQMNFQNPSSMPSMSEIKQPSILVNVTLKDYQLKGLNWLANLYEQGINGILADEMARKTVQSISLMAHLAETHGIWGPFLVIAPASTLHNWQKEISEFLPSLRILPYWGTPKDRVVLRKSLNKKNLIFNKDATFHVVITSYQLIVQDQSYFARLKWQYMILDEAQAIKSSTSARWKTLLGFHCRNRLLLTGTPIQNSMQELWALLHFIMPTLFDSHQEFSEWFSKDIESHAENKGSLNEHQLKRLHMILKPFMLRRVKKNVQNELGEKIEKEIFCLLTARQRVLYRGLREKISVAELLEKAATLPDNDNVDSLMNLVMQFRKVCNHPELFERADVVSPFSFCFYGSTWLISREESLYLPYSSRNYITYEIPKRVFRFLNVPGHGSRAGSRSKILDHLMNIWRPDYIYQSLQDEQNDTFAFLKFLDISPSEASKIFIGNLIQRWVLHLLQRKYRSRNLYMKHDARNDRNTMFLINEMASKLIGSSPTLNVLTNIFENKTQYELVVLDTCYMPKAIAPPIQPVCLDKGFYNDQERLLFDPFIRAALSGIIELVSQNERAQSTVGQLLVQSRGKGIIGQTYRKDQGFSYIRVPPLKKLVLDSGKLTKLDELLKELKAGGHRVLIYFQMTRMIDLMEEYLAYRQYKYLRLDGSSKIHDRRDMVEDWQTRSDIFVFLLSTRAGGLGINLTAADTVIFYDSDWNPTVDQQAMDRAHRLGQTKQVTVYRLITKGTIEERILQRAKQKDEIQKVVISGGEFKQVDFKSREIMSLLLEDDELEAKFKEQHLKRKADEEENKKKGRNNKRRKKDSNGSSSKSLEDLWHEGEPAMAETEGSGVTTPASSVGGTKRKRTNRATSTRTTTKGRAKPRTSSGKIGGGGKTRTSTPI